MPYIPWQTGGQMPHCPYHLKVELDILATSSFDIAHEVRFSRKIGLVFKRLQL